MILLSHHHESKHDNNCLLSSGVTYGSMLSCNYVIAIAVIFCLLCPFTVIVVTFISILKDGIIELAGLPSLYEVVADGVALFLVLISACTISVGLKTLCDNLVGGTDLPCSLASLVTTDKKKDFFYQNLSVAERGAWAAVIGWLLQFIGGLLVLRRNGRLCFRSGSPSPKNPPSTPSQEALERF
ncbi:transmembrane protein 179B-like isoform X2 [Haliotis rufescens]|uniref:transmembrane protein 179B-like isoform X2 n=1 Tax=Haliotis rufescens TaxID=6454 RepID=UPI001EAF8F46|nr:transmembrane protein 179B-like isoform X2 [Haliotis rufescens]